MDTSPPPSSGGWPFRRYFWISVVAAAALSLLTLNTGWMFDDYVWLGVWDNLPQPAPLANTHFDVYRTATGVAEHTAQMSHAGIFPWWVEPGVKLAFFRPLGSALFGLDHLLYNRVAVAYHVHSLLWYVGLVMLVGVLFRRLLPTGLAGLALFLFAVNGSHSAVVGWLSYRVLLVSMLFGVLGLWLHMEWRERQRKGALVGSLIAFALGLAGAETVLIMIPYVLAYEAFAGPGKPSDRLKALIPFGALMTAFLVMYKALGYGAARQDTHLDPYGAPVQWFMGMFARVPAAIAGLTLSAPNDYILDPSYVPTFQLLGAAGLVFFGLLLWGVWPQVEPAERKTLKWLLTGSFLSTWLGSSPLAGARTLIVPSLGMAVALAVVLRCAWRGRALKPRAGAVLAGAAVMALLHVVGAPYVWWQTSGFYSQVDALFKRVNLRYAEALDLEQFPNQRLVVLNAPSGTVGIYGSVQWWSSGRPLPKNWWVLSYKSEEQKVTRTGPNSLELSLTDGKHYLNILEERIYRGVNYPVKQGDEFDMKGMKARIEEADAEGPTRISFTFDVPLEDPSLKFVEWRNRKVIPWTPPALGGPPSLTNARVVD
ncbi:MULTISPECIES: hypothetical protein [Corallococcus]|uniref:hypothetical protein n=1 Tax=Corallococcus TaxID=83461 RepID=UPI00117C63B1|nr:MULTISPECIES: hypothetical protein [Corallococcus]NBD09411.1 hypothetical protein [Corallococcus silvisoli]TSC31370.1 hypothetical protein FOF48_11865 [Corallococcus sp. Z5C101001]